MTGPSIFVGRAKELSDLDALRGAALVTLWGPGGAGKTRLAREHARREKERGANVVWVDLASARTKTDAATAFGAALGVSLEGRDSVADAIAHAAAASEALVVADNVEQLDRDARDLVLAIARAKGARVLVTSQEALGTGGEKTIAVGPMPEADALSLFAAIAGARDEKTVRAIVERLDAMPLAIELAASRVPLLGAEELLTRLDRKLDVLGRTLRATIAWSWELLEKPDQIALGACATFEAPFDVALAEAVMPLDDAAALDALETLRGRALLHAGPPDEKGRPTLFLLESVRDFVREATRDQHFAERHAKAVVDRCIPLATDVAAGKPIAPELERRRADLVNIARSLDDDPGLAGLAAQAALALTTAATVTGPLDVAIDLAPRAADAVRSTDPKLAAKLDLVAAEALRAMGRSEDALVHAERAQEHGGNDALRVRGSVKRARGDIDGAMQDLERANAVGELGAALLSQGRLADARRRHADAIAQHAAAGARRAEGVQRSYLAVATHRAGDVASSIALHEAALAIHREVSHSRLEGAELLHLAFVHHELGAPGKARTAFAEARKVLARAGARGLESFALVLAARLEVDEGDQTAAMMRLAEAAQCAPPGWKRLEATRHLVEGHLAMARGDAASAARSYAASIAASDAVEVGFEALTPAYLSLAEARSGNATGSGFADARAKIAKSENPWLAIALDVLEHGGAASPEAIASSSEVRRALAFAGTRRSLRVSDDVARIVLPDGKEIDLSRRKNIRLVLRALVDARRTRPGDSLSGEAILAAGWPGERMRAEAATKRLHTAIWTLRSLGLGEVLLTEGDGYRLDPSIPLAKL